MSLMWTGERYTDGASAEIAFEHRSRYFMACRLVKDKRVLDVPSGEGYGSHMMSQLAKEVIGIDISQEAIDHANSQYKKDNLSFQHGSMADLSCFENASFDVVVCVEGIEHVDRETQVLALKEFRRVLKDDGVLFISSPNKRVYTDIPQRINKYHIEEYYYDGLLADLKPQYQHVDFYGQNFFRGSFLLAENSSCHAEVMSFNSKGQLLRPDIRDSMYFVVAASNSMVSELDFVGVDTSREIEAEYEKIEAVREKINQDNINRYIDHIQKLESTIEHLRSTIEYVESSLIWKVLVRIKKIVRIIFIIAMAIPRGQGPYYIKKIFSKLRNKSFFAGGYVWIKGFLWKRSVLTTGNRKKLSQESPLVSIILPTKNRINVLNQAIESVYAQSYKHWELIVVDDGSSDGTAEHFQNNVNDARVRFLHNKGLGVCDARNTGLETASGDYIAYLDSDNLWTKNYLEYMLLHILSAGMECSYSYLKCYNQKYFGKFKVGIFYRHEPFNYDRLKNNNFIDLNVFMHSKKLFHQLGGFDVSLKRCVDWELILRYTRGQQLFPAEFVGAIYDNTQSKDRISVKEKVEYANVVRNRYLVDWQSLRDFRQRDTRIHSVVCRTNDLEGLEEYLNGLRRKKELIFPLNVVVCSLVEEMEVSTDKVSSLCELKGYSFVSLPQTYGVPLLMNVGFSKTKGSVITFVDLEHNRSTNESFEISAVSFADKMGFDPLADIDRPFSEVYRGFQKADVYSKLTK